jgi:hypothetical protein
MLYSGIGFCILDVPLVFKGMFLWQCNGTPQFKVIVLGFLPSTGILILETNIDIFFSLSLLWARVYLVGNHNYVFDYIFFTEIVLKNPYAEKNME